MKLCLIKIKGNFAKVSVRKFGLIEVGLFIGSSQPDMSVPQMSHLFANFHDQDVSNSLKSNEQLSPNLIS